MKRKIFALVLACGFLFGGCAGTGNSSTATHEGQEGTQTGAYQKITPEEAKAKIDGGEVTIVDVRRAEEYAKTHIPGAVLVPNETIEEMAAAELPDKTATLLVYCRTGVRSRQASLKLIKLGYQKVYDMGGIADWPYETQSGETSS